MTAVVKDDYLEQLIRAWKNESSTERTASWLGQLQSNAVSQIEASRLPTMRDEEWRFTDISPLKEVFFSRASASAAPAADQVNSYFNEAESRIVFVDGCYKPELSEIAKDSAIEVSSLSAVAGQRDSAASQHFNKLANLRGSVFSTLNTALMHDGVCIVIPADVAVAAPIHIVYLVTQENVAVYPRCLLIAEMRSSVTLIEEYVTLHEHASLTNAVTEIVVGDSARVNHIRVQRENLQTFHIANGSASVKQHGHYHTVNIALGSQISRYDQNVFLAAEEAACAIDGLALISGNQLADTHTFIDHAKPHCSSEQLHKCIVDDGAHGVFSGKIMVHPHAQLTDAKQLNRNLLLSGRARMDTLPQLEIFADDVKCAHGATVGQLDENALFYLQSRGLDILSARNLLTYAFGGEVIDRIEVPSLRQQLESYVLARTKIN